MTPYFCGQQPSPKQTAWLLLNDIKEVFYGGAGGGGKSIGMWMGALQFVDQEDYSALILRRTFTDLSLPGALIDVSRWWLDGTDAKWNEQTHTWSFPSGATITFGHLEYKHSHHRYRSSEFQFIGFDELTEFEEDQYTFLFSRLRRRLGSNIPLRMRSASNPGGRGHEWVKKRFITGDIVPGRAFLPATIADNPYIDKEAYEDSLSRLNEVMRQQIMEGNWDAVEGGKVIDRLWFRMADKLPALPSRVRAWDLAASTDGARTAGVRMGRDVAGNYYIEDVVKDRLAPGPRDELIEQTALADGTLVHILIEQEGGSGGLAQCDALKRHLEDKGFSVEAVPVTGGQLTEKINPQSAKVRRAGPFASALKKGRIWCVPGEWNGDYLAECNVFPEGQYVDQVDATAMAFNWMEDNPGVHGVGDEKEKANVGKCECNHIPHEPWCEGKWDEKEAQAGRGAVSRGIFRVPQGRPPIVRRRY
jgi:predicted phage terminase large subunit-like protein